MPFFVDGYNTTAYVVVLVTCIVPQESKGWGSVYIDLDISRKSFSFFVERKILSHLRSSQRYINPMSDYDTYSESVVRTEGSCIHEAS